MAEHEHAGHRKRLLAKLETGKLEDHEYLEALLFNAIPRLNTNEIAHRLLSRFGSFQGVLEAQIFELQSVKGVGENVAQYLYLIGTIFRKINHKEEKRVFPKKFEENEFKEFLRGYYKDAKVEYLDCFFLDAHARIKQAVRFSTKEENSIDIATDELENVLILNRPHGIIISHNHVKGTSTPSIEDEETTCKIQMTCHLKNIHFYDHFIVSPVDIFSFHSNGHMSVISEDYAPTNIIKMVNSKKNKNLGKKFL